MFQQDMFDQHLKQDILKAIHGEYSAISCYGKLLDVVPTEKIKEIVTEIRNDEITHFNQFCAVYTLMTNKQPVPKITEECPDNYEAIIRFAFEDEQETVDFYQTIADRANHPMIQQLFRRAAADEQHHAVWFLSLMNS